MTVPPELFTKVATTVVGGLFSVAWKHISSQDAGKVFSRVYQQWQEGVAADDRLADHRLQAFELFFSMKDTISELDKLLRDHYQDLNVDVLSQNLRESCQQCGSPLPECDLYPQLQTLVEGPRELLEARPEYREKYQLSLRAAVQNLRRAEPGLQNFSLARHAYLRELRHQHGLIRFRGFAEVGGPTEVGLESVFVTPRLEPDQKEQEQEEMRATVLLDSNGKRTPPSRSVILGKPGAGKTTVLEYFALQQAKQPTGPLPIFYRLRHLEEDRQRHPGRSLWECLHAHCAGRLNLDLPAGFFTKEMRRGGVLLLLDGLDEVVSEARRIEMVDFVSTFVRHLSGSRVIVTSRPHDYGRIRFGEEYRHFHLAEFNDPEIQQFIGGWHRVHEADHAQRASAADELWQALEVNRGMKELAGNALLLTMIVRVHWTQGLPDSRLDLYRKCAETLLKHWSDAKGVGPDPLGLELKRLFLASLAFGLQTEAADLGRALHVHERDLRKKLDGFLREKGEPVSKTETLMERLPKRDAILVHQGGGEFSFVHRSFQEYFASYWLAQEEEARLADFLDVPGWHETVCLAAAQLPAQRLRKFLMDLLRESRVELALACLRAAGKQDAWIARLVEWMAKYTRSGREFANAPVAELADVLAAVPAGRAAAGDVLRNIFVSQRQQTVGAELAAAVELAEELERRGDAEAAGFLQTFCAECPAECDMVLVPGGEFLYQEGERVNLRTFRIDRHPVTNADYERMAPGRRAKRGRHSSEDRQPVVYVNWYEARLYARWRGCRLPDEPEWEKAAVWDPMAQRQRVYPWGDEFFARALQLGGKRPVADDADWQLSRRSECLWLPGHGRQRLGMDVQ